MFYLGIDISKDKFDVALLEGKKNKHKVFKNNEDGFLRLIEWLKTIPGIGDRTAEVILSEIKGGVENFKSARQLAAYAGITPQIKESGTSVKSKGLISRLGNERLRTALYFPSIVAKKHNSLVKVFCERLSEKGKAGKQVVCAGIRKLLHIIYGVLKSHKPFEENYQNLSFYP